MPDRLKVGITAEDRRYRSGEEMEFTVKGMHLFGAPASGRTVRARVNFYETEFTHPDWQG